jgi:hypothetical protein
MEDDFQKVFEIVKQGVGDGLALEDLPVIEFEKSENFD